MDPRKQNLSRYATHHLQFNPGQDLSLLNAMIYTIIEEGLIDEDYVKNNTEGFELLEKEIKSFNPQIMEKICGINSEIIREVARLYAKSKTSIIFCMHSTLRRLSHARGRRAVGRHQLCTQGAHGRLAAPTAHRVGHLCNSVVSGQRV